MSRKKTLPQPKLSLALQILGRPLYLAITSIIIITAFTFRLIQSFGSLIIKKLSNLYQPQKLRPKKRRQKAKIRSSKNTAVLFCLCFTLVSIVSILYYQFFYQLPPVTLLSTTTPALATKILDRHGNLLYQIYKDENRSLVSLSEVPSYVINATLAAEDKGFYSHYGVDPTGIARAALNNLNCYFNLHPCAAVVQGGSTITQQLIKNTLLTSEKTYTRKIKEAILAVKTELHYDKNTILEMYLNQVPYGGVAFGIEEASQTYFGKPIKNVTLAEAAFLAGLPVSPTALSPYGTTPYLAKIRQQQVLESMVKLGMISENEKVSAVLEPLNLKDQGSSIRAPHFVMYIRSLLVNQYGENVVNQGGLTVTTSLDYPLQQILEKEISTELANLKNMQVTNGAGLIISPKTGDILAMVGSHDFFDTKNDGQVNITLQERQPGSAIKPLTYALAFLRGLNPSSYIEDSPVCFRQANSPDYCPKNYDGKFHGNITLKSALGNSYNIPAIKLLNSLGVSNLIELGKNLGITTWDNPERFGLALTLGGGEIKMIDLAQAYTVFANNGQKIPLSPILEVRDSSGNLMPKNSSKSDPIQVIPESVAFQINQTLSDNSARSASFGLHSVLNVKDHVVAVKTGTTNNLRDNWTFGYTKNYLVATWVGNNDNTPMSSVVSGITGASPIWSRTMKHILTFDDSSPFAPPSSIVKARVSCQSEQYEYFSRGKEPRLNCSNDSVGKIL